LEYSSKESGNGVCSLFSGNTIDGPASFRSASINLTNVTDALGRATSYSYDAANQVAQTLFPSALTETYVYDALGNMVSMTDRKGQTISYDYDDLSRLVQKRYPDLSIINYFYDLAGKLEEVSDSTGDYSFGYDGMGRLKNTTTHYAFLNGATYTQSYGYDANSNRTSFSSSDGSTTTYGYDSSNRLTNLADSAAGPFTFSYDALNRQTML
jgi:YD repeat-containing protein